MIETKKRGGEKNPQGNKIYLLPSYTNIDLCTMGSKDKFTHCASNNLLSENSVNELQTAALIQYTNLKTMICNLE